MLPIYFNKTASLRDVLFFKLAFDSLHCHSVLKVYHSCIKVYTMNPPSNKDNGGRRFGLKRRLHRHAGPVLEKRAGQERRSGQDRRRNPDPIIRIIGDERRSVLRKLGNY